MRRLKNYLRTYRKRAGLSQRQVAILLGSFDQTRVSRYELNKRLPSIDVALAYEIILGVPAKTLFAGRAEALEETIRKRAAHLPGNIASRFLSGRATVPPAEGGGKQDGRHA